LVLNGLFVLGSKTLLDERSRRRSVSSPQRWLHPTQIYNWHNLHFVCSQTSIFHKYVHRQTNEVQYLSFPNNGIHLNSMVVAHSLFNGQWFPHGDVSYSYFYLPTSEAPKATFGRTERPLNPSRRIKKVRICPRRASIRLYCIHM